MANLLEEIEGAITDEIDQENDPRARAGGWPIDGSRGHPQAYHHYGPHSAIFGNDIAYQQRGPNACYDSGYGHHAGSSSSYSQLDSPSPATLRNPQEAVICQPPVSLGMMPPPYSVLQPTSTYTAADYHDRSADQQRYIPSTVPAQKQSKNRFVEEYDQDGWTAEQGQYNERVADQLPGTSAVREETGDSSAMKQMQNHGIPLKMTTVLPDAFRRIFKFSCFNAVQSKVYGTNENLVVSSPTGSGKTVIFELAILRAVMNKGKEGDHNRSLCVYIAPLKALCSEKSAEWKAKLGKIGLKIVEFTGDTASDKGFLHETKNADVIITTPEKWDAVTRRMSQKQKILERLALMMLDEVHILNEERGAILETVVARMKVSARDVPVRVVALSATIPNVEDVARWLRPTMPNSSGVFEAGGLNPGVAVDSNAALQLPMAKVFKFGEDFRPTKLTRIVKGFPFRGDNPFPVINRMIQELFPIVCDYSKGKPVLIFAATRNLCGKAASALVKAYQTAKDSGRRLPWSVHNRSKMSFENKQLEELSAFGIAFHHGGLSLDDRRKVETAFRSGVIMTIVATSTLAVGVNLPAHTVILAGTYQWTGSGMIELSDLDVQQMIGRAGRPQYDTEGIAIILCSENNEARYRDLVNSRTTIESCLHEHLTEHINTEIGLRTITCLEEGQEWIRNSFLYVRIQQNPRHYSGILGSTGTSTSRWQETLDMLVANAVEKLRRHEMIQMQETTDTPEPLEVRNISATVYGEAMSANCLSFETMSSILDTPAKASLESLFHTLSNSHEFADMKLRNGEKIFYKSLAKDPDMRFPMPNGVSPSTSAHKVFILIQMTLGNVDWEPYKEQLKQGASGPTLDSYNVFRVAPRICKAIATVALQKEDGETLKNALALNRIISGKAWPNSAVIFRQIDSIGSKSIAVLGAKGFTTFARLAKTDPRHIEMLLNRQTGFGNKIVTAAKTFPSFDVTVTQVTKVSDNAKAPVDIEFRLEITADGPIAGPSSKKQAQSRSISVLALLSDGTYIAYRKANARTLSIEDLSMTLMARIQYANQRFQVIVGLDQASGCSTQVDYKPDVPDGVLCPPVTNGSEQVKLEEVVCEERLDVPTKKLKADASVEIATVDEFEELEMEIVEPPRLPNGNWPCSHACSQKGKCKHACCKEGSKTKPKKLKRNASGTGKPPRTKSAAGNASTKSIKGKKEFDSQHPSAILLRDSDTESEDEKVVINRMLAGGDSFDSLLLDLPRVDLPDDSKEFDDPSFDAALEEMDVNVTVPHSTQGTKRSASATFDLSNIEPSCKRDSTQGMRHADADVYHEKKPVRPQPVKRARTRLELDRNVRPTTNDSKDFETALGVTVEAVASREQRRTRKLFLTTSDESPSPTSLDRAHDFVSNGLVQLQEPSRVTDSELGRGAQDIETISLDGYDGISALDELDQYLNRSPVSVSENASKAHPIAPAIECGRSAVNLVELKRYSSPLALPAEVSGNNTFGSTSNTRQDDMQAETTRSGGETGGGKDKDDEEDDDGLADFERWIEDCGIKVE